MFDSGTLPNEACKRCGSVYRITYTDYPERDTGCIICGVCEETLMEWNGTRDYTAELIEEHRRDCHSASLDPQEPGMNESQRKEIGEKLQKAARLRRKYASAFDWPEKSTKEMYLCSILIRHLLKNGEKGFLRPCIANNGDGPPDCLVTQGGKEVGVEITELVDRAAVEQQIHTKIAYPDTIEWNTGVLSERLNTLIRRKDNHKNREMLRRRYSRYVLLIHTDEPELRCDAFLKIFDPCQLVETWLIDEIFVLFSYDPRDDDTRVLRIR